MPKLRTKERILPKLRSRKMPNLRLKIKNLLKPLKTKSKRKRPR